MKLLSKFGGFAKREPLGCCFAAAFSLALVGAFATAFAFVFYAVFAPALMRNAVKSATGFDATAQRVYANLFTGYCEIENLSIDNGEIYNLGDALPDKNFITAKKIEMELSPLALLRGKLRVSEFRADVPHINCIRLNNYTCNVDEFVGGMRKITEAAAGLSFSLRLETAVYTDCSASAKPISKKQNIDMSFERNGVSDTAKMLGELSAAFDAADAMFISNALLKQ